MRLHANREHCQKNKVSEISNENVLLESENQKLQSRIAEANRMIKCYNLKRTSQSVSRT